MSELTDAIASVVDTTDNREVGMTAEVLGTDSDGTTWVRILGGADRTPLEGSSVELETGDVVEVTIGNGKAVVKSNMSSPSASVASLRDVEAATNRASIAADEAMQNAAVARDAAAGAVASAAEAKETAEGVRGIAEQAQADADSVRDNLRSVVSGATTVEKAVSVMQTAMESIIDYDPNTTQEIFEGDGSETDFALASEATDILSVKVDGEDADYSSAVVGGVTVVTIDPAPASGSEVSIMYEHATVQEWFWHDANGAHVLGDESGYRNDITSTGMNIVDTSTETPVARFGTDGAQIGRVGESRQVLDYHSLRLIDKEGNDYFHVSDLRDRNNEASVTDVFTGDGRTLVFSLSMYAKNKEYEVAVSDSSGGAVSKTTIYVSFSEAPTNGATITVSYTTASPIAKAFTLGSRGDGNIGGMSFVFGDGCVASATYSHAEGVSTKAIGQYSHAEGFATTASGVRSHAEGDHTSASGNWSHAEGDTTTASGNYSHAQNNYTIAARKSQTAIGEYNVEDTGSPYTRGEYALIVGNGADWNNRSNAMAVGWDGRIVFTDMTGFQYPALLDNGSNILIGLEGKPGKHHTGGTVISAGYNDGSSSGNPTAFIDVPNAANDDSNRYGIWHEGNLPQTAWTNLPLNSACEAYDSAQTPKYRKTGGIVNVCGAVKPKTAVAAQGTMTIGVLPEGFRPVVELHMVGQGSGTNIWDILVGPSGTITMRRYRNENGYQQAPTSAWLPFNITFAHA